MSDPLPLPGFRRSGKGVLATIISVSVEGHDILVAASTASALRHVLKRLAPNIDWSNEPTYLVRIAFVAPLENSKPETRNPEHLPA